MPDEKKFAKIDWREALNPLFSYFDSDIRRWLRRQAGHVREDSAWRHEGVERGFDIARGFLEKNVHFGSRAVEFGKEKLTDYGDYWATMLYVGGSSEEKSTPKGRLRTLFGEGGKQIVEADDPKAEAEKVKETIRNKKEALDDFEDFCKSLEPEPEPKSPYKPIELKKRLYGTEEEPGPIPKTKTKAKETMQGANRRLDSWLRERGA